MDSQAIEEIAMRWIVRRHEGWTDSDQAALEQWLQASTAHRIAYLRLDEAWSQAARLKALGAGLSAGVVPPRRTWSGTNPTLEATVPSRAARGKQRPAAGRRRWPAVAAVTLLLIGSSCVYWLLDRVRGDHYSTAIGGLKTLSLADGSQVTLNTNTSIRVLLRDSERRIELDRGEAFFVVAKDRARPFVVYVAGQSVIAVGTQFSVRRESDDVQVVVTEGRVNLAPAAANGGSPEPTALGAGAIAHTLSRKVIVTSHTVPEVQELLAWRRGFLSFHDTPLAEAVAEFNRYNARQIVIADTAIASILVGGNFRPNNADSFLWLLERGFPVDVEWGKERIVLKPAAR
jgi:transmembrane sensor